MKKIILFLFLISFSINLFAFDAEFFPNRRARNASEIRIKFSKPVAPLGDPSFNYNPVDKISCLNKDIKGIWEDTSLYVIKFEEPLKAGILCIIILKNDIRSIDGEKYNGRKEVQFDTDVITVEQIVPHPSQPIKNEEIFIFSFTGDIDINKNINRIFFKRSYTSDIVEAVLIEQSDVQQIIENIYPYLTNKNKKYFGIKPKIRFADNEEIMLIFKDIISTSGIPSNLEEKYTYTVMAGFKIELSCTREKAESGCVPISDIVVNFSQPIKREYIKDIFISDENGNKLIPKTIRDNDDIIYSISFSKPFKPEHSYILHIPNDIKDIYERTPVNINKFPLNFKTDRMPPLAKFAADFGIVEMIDGEGILPLTIRGLKNNVNIKTFGIENDIVNRVEKEKGFFARVWEIILNLFKLLFMSNKESTKDLSDENKFILPAIKIKSLKLSDLPNKKIFEFINNMRYEDLSKNVFDSNKYSYEENRLIDISSFEETTVVGIPLKKYGLYFFELESAVLGDFLVRDNEEKKNNETEPKNKQMAYIHSVALVTDLAITFKRGRNSSLVFVTRLSDASPVENAKINVYDCEGNEYYSGTTNELGILYIDKNLPDDNSLPTCTREQTESYYESHYKFLNEGLTIIAIYNDDFSLVNSMWDKGIEPYRYNIYDSHLYNKYVLHSVFSRNLLRSGETLHIKSYFREKGNKEFRLATYDKLPQKIRIEHLGTEKRWEYDIRWDDNGNSLFIWEVPRDAYTGHYRVTYFNCLSENKCDYTSSETFLVEEFKIPLIKGDLIVDDSKNNNKIIVNGLFNYLMGAPANDLKVSLRYKFLKNYEFFEPKYKDFVFLNGKVEAGIIKNKIYYQDEYENEYIDTYHTEDDNKTPTNLWKIVNLNTDEYGRFTTEIDKSIMEDGKPLVLKLEAGYTDPNGYFNTIDKSEVIYTSSLIPGIQTNVDHKKRQISAKAIILNKDKTPVKGEKVKLNLYKSTSYVHRKKILGGYYSFENIKEIKPIGEFCSGTTDENGMILCEKNIEEGGFYLIEVVCGDRKKGISYSNNSFYLFDYEEDHWFDYASDSDRIDISTDKKEYKDNEIAKLKIVTPFEKATALITFERNGILDYFLTEVYAKRPEIEFRIKPEYAPNVFISVVLIRGRVSEPPPTFLVDLARPSFKMGITEINVDKNRHRLDIKVTTEKKKYNVREKVKGSVEFKTLEGENPDVMLIVVDEGLLQLMENPTYNILDNIIKRENIGVETSTALTQVVGKRHFGKKSLPSGGGGGRIVTREMFDTLIYFNGSLPFKNNRADFEFLLNDSITSFKIIAIAATTNRFGSGYTNIESTKDIFINSSLPYFARENDIFDAEFVIKSVSDKAYNLQIKGGVTFFRNGKEFKKEDFKTETLYITPNGNKKVSFNIKIPKLVNEAKYKLDVILDNKIFDSISVVQKIVEAEPSTVVHSTFKRASKPSRDEYKYLIKDGADQKINISFMSNLGEINKQIMNFSGFEHACLEQKMSYAIVANSSDIYNRIINEINLYLDDNGLLKYYPSSKEGSVMLTAYILDITDIADFKLPDNVIYSTTNALKNFIMGKTFRKNTFIETTTFIEKIHALAVLSRYYKKEATDLFSSLSIEMSKLSLSSIIDIGYITGKHPEISNAIMSFFTESSGAYFIKPDDRNRFWWLMRSEDEAFARTLIFLINTNTDDTTIGKMANGLINRFKQNGYLYNTTANAYAMASLRLFAKKYETTFKNSVLNVSYNCNLYKEKIDSNFKYKNFIFDITKDGEVFGGETIADCTTKNNTLFYEDNKNNYWVKMLILNREPLKEAINKGFKITKEYLNENGEIKKEFKQGDLVKVRISIEQDSLYNNFVLIDPLITGAQVVGRIKKDDSTPSELFWDYTYSDVRDGTIRTYYEYTYSKNIIFEYSMRLNTKGKFNLPPTRVELMYMPDVFGMIPNKQIEVQ